MLWDAMEIATGGQEEGWSAEGQQRRLLCWYSRSLDEGQENSWGNWEKSEESCLKAWVGMKKATGNIEASLRGLGGRSRSWSTEVRKK